MQSHTFPILVTIQQSYEPITLTKYPTECDLANARVCNHISWQICDSVI
jgi:hypothetical protein